MERLLFPTDFSQNSSDAFRHALLIAQRFGARLKVIHVIPRTLGGLDPAYLEIPPPLPPESRERLDLEMRRFLAPAREAHFDHQFEIREGEPWKEILAEAENTPTDLVVMGTRGSSGVEQFLLGSVTEKLIHRLPCPVMTVCHEEGKTWEAPGLISHIICATDFADSSAEVLRYALAFAEKHRASVTLLHSVEDTPQTDESEFIDVGPLRSDLERQAKARLDAIIESVGPAADQVTAQVTFGRAYKEILRVAATERADLIVIGAHGHGRLQHFFSGSNAQQVIRGATCPVLMVRPMVEKAKTVEAQSTGLTLA